MCRRDRPQAAGGAPSRRNGECRSTDDRAPASRSFGQCRRDYRFHPDPEAFPLPLTSSAFRRARHRIDLRDRSESNASVGWSSKRSRIGCSDTYAGKPSRVLTREELMRDVWGYQNAGRTRTLDSHACRLRARLCSDTHRLVINVWGVGLRLIDG